MTSDIHLQKNFREAKKQFLAVQILYNYPEIQAAALFQAAGCQERLKEHGDAVKTLELLIETYPKSQFAAMAKTRLPRLRRLANS